MKRKPARERTGHGADGVDGVDRAEAASDALGGASAQRQRQRECRAQADGGRAGSGRRSATTRGAAAARRVRRHSPSAPRRSTGSAVRPASRCSWWSSPPGRARWPATLLAGARGSPSTIPRRSRWRRRRSRPPAWPRTRRWWGPAPARGCGSRQSRASARRSPRAPGRRRPATARRPVRRKGAVHRIAWRCVPARERARHAAPYRAVLLTRPGPPPRRSGGSPVASAPSVRITT